MLQVQYRMTDGFIVGIWEATPPSMLAQQDTGTDPTLSTVLIDTMLAPMTALNGYYVQDGTLVEKLALTLSATPNPFAADGVTVCEVTVAPFVPCTLVVDGQASALSVADPVLELTASAPHVFWISLEPMGPYAAAPLSVEAA